MRPATLHIWTLVGLADCWAIIEDHHLMTASVKHCLNGSSKSEQPVFCLFFSLPVPYFFFQAYFDSFLAKACVLLHTERQLPLIAGHLKPVQTYLRQCIKRETGISHCTHNDSVMSWWNRDIMKTKLPMEKLFLKKPCVCRKKTTKISGHIQDQCNPGLKPSSHL